MLWHMRRSIQAFANFGITVTAVPVGIDPVPALVASDFVPQASALEHELIMHCTEWIGCAYYAIPLDLCCIDVLGYV